VLNAETILRQLLGLYGDGLRRPLPFFPESSWEFVTRKRNGSAHPADDARKKWDGGYKQPGEREDEHMALCCRNVATPLDARWEELSERILAPLFESME
jgi:exodeoxyribonuclease V gamma subunit